jgi:hypothetical protein
MKKLIAIKLCDESGVWDIPSGNVLIPILIEIPINS